jgi:hypothetical protein
MADWTKFRTRLRHYAASVTTNGKELERSLQLASGAVVITMLSVLPTTWVSEADPVAQLKPLYADVMIGSGLTFLFALVATLNRSMHFGADESDQEAGMGDLLARLGIWAAPVALSVFMMIKTGVSLITALDTIS